MTLVRTATEIPGSVLIDNHFFFLLKHGFIGIEISNTGSVVHLWNRGKL